MVTEEKSAGVILYRLDNDKVFFLLLKYEAGHWGFPKGHIEQKESEIETLTRELAEETGIEDIEVVDAFRKTIEYFFKRGNKSVHKEVVYYLARTSQKDVVLSHEHVDYAWLEFDDAMERLTFKNSKNLLMAASDFLK